MIFRVDVSPFTGPRFEIGANASTPEEAARLSFRAVASDFTTPAKSREGTDLYGPYVEYTGRRLSGRECISARVRLPLPPSPAAGERAS